MEAHLPTSLQTTQRIHEVEKEKACNAGLFELLSRIELTENSIQVGVPQITSCRPCPAFHHPEEQEDCLPVTR